ncbi:TonB-dependent receptor [Croceicoccus sediminis]|uniref:TonB-dependent receptor n=1 Tax=Croceicoccus sediminis TaxID=2571150 RepID=UPI00196B0F7B|nr:TonB-dependent receptor [Croceicoccus sediminis]
MQQQLSRNRHAVGYGIEGELTARPAPGLDLTLGGSWNFTEIRDDALFIAPCGGGCTMEDPINGDGLAVIDGNDLPQAPRYVANGTLRYGVPVGAGEVYVFTDWAYRSGANVRARTSSFTKRRSSAAKT